MGNEFVHQPVMLAEAVEALQPRAGARYVDCTLGGGSHATAILRASSPDGWLYGCDRDLAAVAAAGERLKEFTGRFEIRQANFSRLAEWIGQRSCDGVLADLGVSSHQLDRPERGFSFQQDAKLDMRMDPVGQTATAADLVNRLSEAELSRLFWELGDEPESRRIARALVQERRQGRLETTGQLARLIERVVPRRGSRIHPATRVFQALRMATNEEVEALKEGLAAAWLVLKAQGRLAVLTFHSVEDRIVKEFGREKARDYIVRGEVDLPDFREARAPEGRWVRRKPMTPGDVEVRANPRARSAKLRVIEKTK
ncbi:MAG TPA: 16S rRNA (cytosine(1402)-N(4))-methyltransferase RsmH [Candidatus Binatia bacterium]|nr:16S rRNA (cytosine(1402)-N(4))-methyltransferase RsmH [Candidatus Binatia bacterium]